MLWKLTVSSARGYARIAPFDFLLSCKNQVVAVSMPVSDIVDSCQERGENKAFYTMPKQPDTAYEAG